MMNPLEASRSFAAGKALSYRQTYHIQGGLKKWTAVRPGVLLIEVTDICKELAHNLDDDARVASVHLSYMKSAKNPWRQASDMIDARNDILKMGYSHLAISGPLTDLANRRLCEVARFQNAAPFVAFNVFIYKSLTRLAVLFPSKNNARRKAFLHRMRTQAKKGFESYVLFDLRGVKK